MEMKHIKTQKQLNEASEKLNISDVISRKSFYLSLYNTWTVTR